MKKYDVNARWSNFNFFKSLKRMSVMIIFETNLIWTWELESFLIRVKQNNLSQVRH